jgi:hypothetical protein
MIEFCSLTSRPGCSGCSQAASVIHQNAPHACAAKSAPCPLCRKQFTAADLVRIKPAQEPEMTDAAPKDGEEAAAMSGNGSGSGGGESSSTTAMEVEKSVEAVVEETTEVRWTAAATADDAIAVAALGGRELLRRDGAYPAVPRLLLSHHTAAARGLTPKVAALIAVMDELTARAGPAAKAVVFSQVGDWLPCWGGCRTITSV